MICTACNGHGWYYGGDWSHAYPKRKCDVCKGSGRMKRDPQTNEWVVEQQQEGSAA